MKRCITVLLFLVLMTSLVSCASSQGDKSSSTPVSSAGGTSSGAVSDSGLSPQEETYQQAIALMNEAKYDEAIGLFESLNGYSNSATMIVECKYCKAGLLLDQKNYEAAYALLTGIKEYKNTQELLNNFSWKYTKSKETNSVGADLTTEYIYTYDENGYITSSSYTSEYGSNFYSYSYEFDENGRVKKQTSISNVGYVTKYWYQYDANGNKTQETATYNEAYTQVTRYTYDNQGRVVQEDIPDTETVVTYTYDEYGNPTQKAVNALLFKYENEYNSDGKLVKCTYKTETGYSIVYEYTYDARGLLIKEVADEGSGVIKTKEYSDFVCFYHP